MYGRPAAGAGAGAVDGLKRVDAGVQSWGGSSLNGYSVLGHDRLISNA